MRKENMVLAVCAVGFLALSVEARYEHRVVVERLPTAWIPVVYGGVGCLACLLVMAQSGWVKRVAQYILVLGVAVGLAGIYLHTGGDTAVAGAYVEAWQKQGAHVKPVWPPALAPASFLALSLVALAASSNGKRR